ncbi:hypothetical protein GCM10010217_23370 [Streptomyces tubercidicus]
MASSRFLSDDQSSSTGLSSGAIAERTSFVPAAEADAAVLHRLMRLSITTTANTIGTEATSVT